MRQNLARAISQDADSLIITRKIIDGCIEAKALDIVAIDASEVSCLFNYFVIASGNSDRQVQGITNRVTEYMYDCGLKPISIEGMNLGHWVVVDYSDIVLHVFYQPLRSHYDLEWLWAKAKRIY